MDKGIAKSRRAESLVFWFLVIVGLGQIFLVAYVPRARHNAMLADKAARLEAEVEDLRRRYKALHQQHEALKNDLFYVEAMARRELNLVGAEEIELPRLAVPTTDPPGPSTAPSPPTQGISRFPELFAPLATDRLARGMVLATGLVLVAAAFMISFRSAERRALRNR